MVISIFPTSADLTSAEKEDLKRLTAEMMALETFIDLNANGTMEELALRAINKADELVIKLDPENFQNAKNNKTQLAAVNSKYNRSLVLQTKAYSIPIVSCDVAVSNSAPTTTAETEGQNIAEARDQAWEAHAASISDAPQEDYVTREEFNAYQTTQANMDKSRDDQLAALMQKANTTGISENELNVVLEQSGPVGTFENNGETIKVAHPYGQAIGFKRMAIIGSINQWYSIGYPY